MQEQTAKMAYSEYLECRLQKIQKYILANKIKSEQNNLQQVQIDKSKQQILQMEEKLKWINVKVTDLLNLFQRLENRLEKFESRVQKFQAVGDKVGRIEQFCGKNCCNLVLKSDIEIMNKYIEENIVKTQTKQKTDFRDLASQLQYVKQQLNSLESQVQKMQKLHNNYQNEDKIYKGEEINLPTQILVTKKELRESIQLMEKIYGRKISKLEGRVKKYWEQSRRQSQVSNKRAIGTAYSTSGQKMATNQNPYQNEYFQQQIKSKHSNINSYDKQQGQWSTLNLKPLLLEQKRRSTSRSKRKKKSKSKKKKEDHKRKSKIKSERSEKRTSSYSNSKYKKRVL